MLILQRRIGESLRIGEDVEISILSVEGSRVRLAINAPKEVPILRSELIQAQAANQESAQEQNAAPAELLQMLGEVLPAEGAAHPRLPVKPVTPAGPPADSQ